MAEQEVVWNKPLLLVAFLLGVLAAVLFIVYDHTMQRKLSGDVINVFQWRDDFPANRKVTLNDVTKIPMRRVFAKQMADRGGILNEGDSVLLLGDNVKLSRSVTRGEWVRSTDVLGGGDSNRGLNPRDGMRTVTLRVDPNTAPVGLEVHARVDLYGLMNDPTKGASRSYTILQNVRVLAVGSRTEGDENAFRPTGSNYRGASGRSYRTVTVEVAPKTAQLMVEVLDRIRGGKVWVSIRPISDDPSLEDPRRPAPGEGELTPEVLALLGRHAARSSG